MNTNSVQSLEPTASHPNLIQCQSSLMLENQKQNQNLSQLQIRGDHMQTSTDNYQILFEDSNSAAKSKPNQLPSVPRPLHIQRVDRSVQLERHQTSVLLSSSLHAPIQNKKADFIANDRQQQPFALKQQLTRVSSLRNQEMKLNQSTTHIYSRKTSR